MSPARPRSRSRRLATLVPLVATAMMLVVLAWLVAAAGPEESHATVAAPVAGTAPVEAAPAGAQQRR